MGQVGEDAGELGRELEVDLNALIEDLSCEAAESGV